jgi:alkylation response protein AidB-like acyl-CoA dehydrogenase
MNFGLAEEQQMVKDQVTKFAETRIKPIAAELDKTHRHPEEICRALGEMGVMGVAIPTEYGGAGMDIVTYVHAMIAIPKACASCGVIVSVNNSLYGFPVNTFGTEAQKLQYLTPVASGKVEGCYALTEAGAGSDVSALACKVTSSLSMAPSVSSPMAMWLSIACWRRRPMRAGATRPLST